MLADRFKRKVEKVSEQEFKHRLMIAFWAARVAVQALTHTASQGYDKASDLEAFIRSSYPNMLTEQDRFRLSAFASVFVGRTLEDCEAYTGWPFLSLLFPEIEREPEGTKTVENNSNKE